MGYLSWPVVLGKLSLGPCRTRLIEHGRVGLIHLAIQSDQLFNSRSQCLQHTRSVVHFLWLAVHQVHHAQVLGQGLSADFISEEKGGHPAHHRQQHDHSMHICQQRCRCSCEQAVLQTHFKDPAQPDHQAPVVKIVWQRS